MYKIRKEMRIDILSAVPELLESPLNHSIIKRAKEKSIVEIHIHNIRDWSKDKYKRIDDYSFGPDAGMVLQIEPIYDAITELCSEREYDHVIYTSPDGDRLNQKMSNTLSLSGNIIILCGHYKGIDQRIRDFLITKEISIGDYVLTGGELAAAVIIDSIVRLLPGAMSDETSALTDTFQDDLLAPPIYTRPAEFNGWKVPDILISGDHKKIKDWQETEAYKRTRLLRPDLLDENE